MAVPAIATEGLTRDYGPVRAVDDLYLEVESGEVFGFLGPNGAGKTTAIRVLLDLIRPTAGRATVMGFDCQRDSIEVRKRVGYLPGDLQLYEGMTGGDLLEFFGSLRPDDVDRAYRHELMERLDLDPHKHVDDYSRGNKQKLGLIQALMHRPDVMVLDEPANGLDPLVQRELWSILDDAADEGRTVFFSSHVLSDVERICKRVAIIREGRLDAVVKAAAQFEVVDLRTEQPSLEEIFIAYYQRSSKREPKDAT